MKKFYSILAVAAVVVTLTSCGSKTAETNADSTATVATEAPATMDTAAKMVDSAAVMADSAAAKMK